MTQQDQATQDRFRPETSRGHYLLEVFGILAAFLTNQFHKWAHMDTPPTFVGWLQAWGVILSREHHDIHHESPYDTTTASPRGSGTPYWTAPAFSSGWSV
jgi:hypothetical protein